MHIKYPAENPATSYPVPRKNVLLISCIDLRLTDDLTRFMDSDNLTNRYDHYIMAGTSLPFFLKNQKNAGPKDSGAKKDGASNPNWDVWIQAMDQHIDIAIKLHNIHDIYIVEHENCGAYKAFHPGCTNEIACQQLNSEALAEHLHKTYKYKEDDGSFAPVSTHAFRMDMRGNVQHFQSFPGH